EVPDPIERQKSLLGLQSAQLGLRNQQLAVSKAEREQRQSEAIAQAIHDTGGDLEAALPKIAEVAPELLPHFQQFVEEQKTLNINRDIQGRAQDLDNIKLTQGTPGPKVGQPETVMPEAQDAGTRQVAGVTVQNPQATPAPIPGGFEQQH